MYGARKILKYEKGKKLKTTIKLSKLIKTKPQGCPSAPALIALFHALYLDWRSISHMVIYMFQCYSLKSSYPHRVQYPYLCLFCHPAYRIIITIFLNSIYMCSVQFSPVTQSCPTLCNFMNCSTPGLPVHHQLPEFMQTHVH